MFNYPTLAESYKVAALDAMNRVNAIRRLAAWPARTTVTTRAQPVTIRADMRTARYSGTESGTWALRHRAGVRSTGSAAGVAGRPATIA